jgi:hypothetical protein
VSIFTERSGSVGVGDGEGVRERVDDGDDEGDAKGLEGLGRGESDALSRRPLSLGRRGPPESANATTVPVIAASAIIPPYSRQLARTRRRLRAR